MERMVTSLCPLVKSSATPPGRDGREIPFGMPLDPPPGVDTPAPTEFVHVQGQERFAHIYTLRRPGPGEDWSADKRYHHDYSHSIPRG